MKKILSSEIFWYAILLMILLILVGAGICLLRSGKQLAGAFCLGMVLLWFLFLEKPIIIAEHFKKKFGLMK